MRKANIKTVTLNIKGNQVTVPKPSVKEIIKLEDKYLDFATGSIDEEGMVDELLKMIPTPTGKPYTKEDFIEYNEQTVTILVTDEEGEEKEVTLTSNEVPYEKYKSAIDSMGSNIGRVAFAEAFLALCAQPHGIIDSLDYEGINDCALAFGDLFDGGELDTLVEELSKFRK